MGEESHVDITIVIPRNQIDTLCILITLGILRSALNDKRKLFSD
jgi:hypothetical protein